MNPLKAFVYAAAGVPIVSTPVANLAEFDDLVTVAHGVAGFGSAIAAAIEGGRKPQPVEVLVPHSWETRVDQVLGLIDRSLGDDRT